METKLLNLVNLIFLQYINGHLVVGVYLLVGDHGSIWIELGLMHWICKMNYPQIEHLNHCLVYILHVMTFWGNGYPCFMNQYIKHLKWK